MTTPVPPAAAPGNDRTTLWSVLGIVGAFCCWPLGLLFAILGYLEAKRRGTSPTLVYVAFGLLALTLVLNLVLFASGSYPGLSR